MSSCMGSLHTPQTLVLTDYATLAAAAGRQHSSQPAVLMWLLYWLVCPLFMQVPHHDFRLVEDEGGGVVKIDVELPGGSLNLVLLLAHPSKCPRTLPKPYMHCGTGVLAAFNCAYMWIVWIFPKIYI